MNELALFAGAGGGLLGGRLLGWRTRCAVEIDSYARSVLLARQRDGALEPFPIWDDVTTFNGHQWRGHIDVVSGGFPCQDISAAGKGAGISGERSGLWSHMARVIGEVQPEYVLVENSPMLVSRGLDVVLADLAALGFDAEWGVIGAHHAGAPHKRDRIWLLAYPGKIRRNTRRPAKSLQRPWENGQTQHMADAARIQPGRQKPRAVRKRTRVRGQPLSDATQQRLAKRKGEPGNDGEKFKAVMRNGGVRWWDIDPADLPDADYEHDDHAGHDPDHVCWKQSASTGIWTMPEWPTESRVGRVADGVAHRVDRLKAIGNGQVPAVVALAWQTLSDRIETNT